MTIAVVPPQSPAQGQIQLDPMSTPYSALWWTSQTLTEIPSDALGWLASQGWAIIGAPSYDTSTTPPTPYYSMGRESLQNWQILQSLLNSYSVAYNDARWANSLRYNQVIANWTEVIGSTQAHFDAEVAEQNAHVAIYLGNLESYMAQVDALIDANQTQLVADAAVATTALTALDAKLGDLETNVTTHTATINGLLTDQAGYLGSFLTNFAAKINELDLNYISHLTNMETLLGNADTDLSIFATTQSDGLAQLSAAYSVHVLELEFLLNTAGTYLADLANEIDSVLTAAAADYSTLESEIDTLLVSGTTAFDSYAADYNTVLAQLEADYTTHAVTATAFLTGLGVTELARINEKFDATLATQLEQLVDRGIYSSSVTVDVTARNTRDRNEEIGILNDRLNRERFENQHRLYDQQVALRGRTLDGKDRVHTVRQEVWRYQASQITGLYGLLQGARDRTLSTQQALYSLRDANSRLNLEVQSRLHETGQAMRRVLVEEAARLHQLQQSVTQFKTGQRDRLLEQIQGIVSQHLTGISQRHAAEQDVSRLATSERGTLLGQLQDAVRGLIAGKERYSAMTMQNASTLAEQRHRMVVEKMNEYAARLEGLRGNHADNMKLMAYQLSERNQLLIGLYGFVERREDIGPKFEELAKVCTSLGDAGGGWITP